MCAYVAVYFVAILGCFGRVDAGRTIRQIPDVFKEIQEQLGGDVFKTNKGQVNDTVQVIEGSITNTAEVTITKLEWSREDKNSDKHIKVDSLVSNVRVQAQGQEGSPSLAFYHPNGTLYTDVEAAQAGALVRSYNIFNSTPGVWTVRRQTNDTYELHVTGKSTLDFTYQFMDPDTGDRFPLAGQPNPGTDIKLDTRLTELDVIENVTLVVLVDSAGKYMYSTRPLQGAGKNKNTFRSSVTIPDQPFRITVNGFDKNGYMFVRQQEAIISPKSASATTASSQVNLTTAQSTVRSSAGRVDYTTSPILTTSSLSGCPSVHHMSFCVTLTELLCLLTIKVMIRVQ